jgi:diguanylate cyclase
MISRKSAAASHYKSNRQRIPSGRSRRAIIGRYGGEGFAVVLPGASLKNAIKKARNICRQIGGARFTFDEHNANEALSVTVSIGVSSFLEGDTCQSIIERTDNALY